MARWGRVRLYRFTYRAVAARGSSCQNVVPRTCRGLPGAWAAAPAYGRAYGFRRMRLVPSSMNRRVWTMDGYWPPWWGRPPGVAAPAFLARPPRLPGGASRVGRGCVS